MDPMLYNKDPKKWKISRGRRGIVRVMQCETQLAIAGTEDKRGPRKMGHLQKPERARKWVFPKIIQKALTAT